MEASRQTWASFFLFRTLLF